MEVTLNVPESLKEFVDAEVAAGGHGTAANYIQAMLVEAAQRKAREHIEALLEEGLNSEDVEWTPEVMAELKREVAEYHSRQKPDRP